MNFDKCVDYFLGDATFVKTIDAGDFPAAMRYVRAALRSVPTDDCETVVQLAINRLEINRGVNRPARQKQEAHVI